MPLNRHTTTQILIAVALVLIAVAWRIINHHSMIMPNLEFVTATSLFAAYYLPKPWGLSIPIATLFLSDILIGNSSIAWFTWSAFIIIGLSGLALSRLKTSTQKLITASAGLGLASAIFFFLWTNFGVWLLGDGTFYPHTLAGLLLCYDMGLPFFRATLISGLVLTPTFFAIALYIPKLLEVTVRRLAITK